MLRCGAKGFLLQVMQLDCVRLAGQAQNPIAIRCSPSETEPDIWSVQTFAAPLSPFMVSPFSDCLSVCLSISCMLSALTTCNCMWWLHASLLLSHTFRHQHATAVGGSHRLLNTQARSQTNALAVHATYKSDTFAKGFVTNLSKGLFFLVQTLVVVCRSCQLTA